MPDGSNKGNPGSDPSPIAGNGIHFNLSQYQSEEASQVIAEFESMMKSFTIKLPVFRISQESQDSMKKLWDGINRSMAAVTSHFVEMAKQAKEAFEARLSVYPALKEEILPLAKRGWFISKYFGISELDMLARIASENPSDLDSAMAKLYREDLSDHFRQISEHYPSKAFFLKPAVEAHLRGEYAVSIPIFFIAIDGIAREKTRRYFFHKGADGYFYGVAESELRDLDGKEKEGLYLDFFSLVDMIFWESLSERLPIAYDERLRGKHDYAGLNRHIFLHGDFTEEQATEESSLKAFSLLSCLSSHLEDYGEGEGALAPKLSR